MGRRAAVAPFNQASGRGAQPGGGYALRRGVPVRLVAIEVTEAAVSEPLTMRGWFTSQPMRAFVLPVLNLGQPTPLCAVRDRAGAVIVTAGAHVAHAADTLRHCTASYESKE